MALTEDLASAKPGGPPTNRHTTGHTQPEAICVTDLLAEPMLRNTLVAGSAGMDTAVRWCLPLAESGSNHAGEGIVVYAHADRLRGDEGITTVERARSAGVVALFVNLDVADLGEPVDLSDAFPEARAAADAAGLPLVLLPPTADYRAVSQLVATKVLAQTTHVLQYSDRVHRSLGQILARGAGVASLAYGMARMSDAAVIVVDLDGAVLAHEILGTAAKPQPEPIVAALVRHLESVVGDAAPQHRSTVLNPVGTGADIVVPIAAPVTFGGEVSGLAAVLERPGGDAHDRAQRLIVVEEGAVLIGSEMLRIQSMIEAEERTRGDFIIELVHGRFADGQQLQARARHHGFEIDGRYAVLVAAPDPPVTDDARAVRRFHAAARAVERLETHATAPTLAAQIAGNLVVIAPTSDPTGNATREIAGGIRRVLREHLDVDTRVAFGRTGTGSSGVSTSYREARTALTLGRRVDIPPVAGYDDLRIFVALRDLADSENGRRFAAEILAPLRRGDGNARSLESVVQAYIAESGNLNAAARRLGLHRNTTLYKLDRVSRALHMDIRSAETQFMVWLAHHIDTLSHVNDSLDAELEPPS